MTIDRKAARELINRERFGDLIQGDIDLVFTMLEQALDELDTQEAMINRRQRTLEAKNDIHDH